MDPNETLKSLRAVAREVRARADAADREGVALDDLTEEAENLSTLFEALDTWISEGGFLPKSWTDEGV